MSTIHAKLLIRDKFGALEEPKCSENAIICGWMGVEGLLGAPHNLNSTLVLLLNCVTNGEGKKLISTYLSPLSSDAFICPAAVTPHFKLKFTLHVLFANIP